MSKVKNLQQECLCSTLRNLDPEWEETFDLPIAAEPDNLEAGVSSLQLKVR